MTEDVNDQSMNYSSKSNDNLKSKAGQNLNDSSSFNNQTNNSNYSANSAQLFDLNTSGNNQNNNSMSFSQQIQQQQAESSPITAQLNKIIKKTRRDNEKKMLLTDEDFS
jgi:hypothetical protein